MTDFNTLLVLLAFGGTILALINKEPTWSTLKLELFRPCFYISWLCSVSNHQCKIDSKVPYAVHGTYFFVSFIFLIINAFMLIDQLFFQVGFTYATISGYLLSPLITVYFFPSAVFNLRKLVIEIFSSFGIVLNIDFFDKIKEDYLKERDELKNEKEDTSST